MMVTQNMFVFRFVAIHASTQLSSYPDCEVTLIKSSLRRNILINKIYLINLNEKSTEQIGNAGRNFAKGLHKGSIRYCRICRSIFIP